MAELRNSELAALLGLSIPRLSQLVREGMPKVRRGVYDEDACLAWYEKHSGRQIDRGTDPVLGAPVHAEPEETQADARLRYLVAKADQVELTNRRISGSLVESEKVIRILRQRDATVIAAGDQWVAEATTGADRSLRLTLFTALRTRLLDTIQSAEVDLASGDDMVSTRARNG